MVNFSYCFIRNKNNDIELFQNSSIILDPPLTRQSLIIPIPPPATINLTKHIKPQTLQPKITPKLHLLNFLALTTPTPLPLPPALPQIPFL